ncbi:unnamed protein product [Calypogeia fissa]
MLHPDADKWQAAEELELHQLQQLQVAELVPLPPGVKLLPSKWVYTPKRNGIFKSRFVIRGDKQRPGMDYGDTFAPVVCLETFQLVMTLIAAYDLEAHCWDIVTAFLNALIQAGLFLYVQLLLDMPPTILMGMSWSGYSFVHSMGSSKHPAYGTKNSQHFCLQMDFLSYLLIHVCLKDRLVNSLWSGLMKL